MRWWSGWATATAACTSSKSSSSARTAEGATLEAVAGSRAQAPTLAVATTTSIAAAAGEGEGGPNVEGDSDGENDFDVDAECGECDGGHKLQGADKLAQQQAPRPSTGHLKEIGTMVKRVLDFGRVVYLREELGMHANLVRYCDPDWSPECMMIVASSYDAEK
jgi:hypothetical protein